ncbi:DUF3566 domain-containing protein [Cutibacterium equinum]|uniref:DUF3566 domain-containing protein n=1 Tax=Cutibacterium equinum TaxID=3016342 RepID=A0ABY7QY63_9ACTN|nr:DUF3566 domain-containing protein [Cutibacterium equinum]WCC79988.1 DUF3566 domain-containing protein [Cutibacterium equinum]
MSDEKTVMHPGPDDPEATRWTAGDARRTFQGEGQQRPDPRQESDRKRTTASTPTRKRTDSSATTWEKAPSQSQSRPAQARQPARAARRTRKARLRLTRVDPWSVMKTSLLFGVAGAVILFIATWIIWGIIGASGALDSLNKVANDLISSPSSNSKFQLSDYVNTGRVLGLTALIGAINAVLFTAISTLFSFLYNLAAQIMGGLEVTLAED